MNGDNPLETSGTSDVATQNRSARQSFQRDFFTEFPPMLYRLPPPFTNIADRSMDAGNDIAHGDVLVVRFPAARDGWNEIAGRSVDLLRRFPGHPLAFWGDGLDGDGYILLTELARDHGVRAVVRSERPDANFLRAQLADERSLVRDVPRWLIRMRIVRDVRLEPVLERFLELSRRYGTAQRILRDMGISDRTARTWFNGSEVLSPGRLIRLARTLRPVLRLQREPDLRISLLARAYWNTDRFRSACQDLFRASPNELRRSLGFEPLLARYLDLRCDSRGSATELTGTLLPESGVPADVRTTHS